MSVVDQWCVLAKNRTETVFIRAIHLPSLLYLPAPISPSLMSPNGTELRTGEEHAGVHYFVDVMPSRDSVSRHEGTSDYTVVLSRYSHRFTFDIRIDVVPGSIHGNIVWPGTRLSLPTNRTLEDRISCQFPRRDSGISKQNSTVPLWFVAARHGFEVLVTGFRLGNYIQILRMINLWKSNHTRTLSWKAPLRRSTAVSATVKMDYQDDADEVRALPYWDAGTGMLLLRGPPLSGGLYGYQTCWF
jgi:hypothetical protein